MTENSESNDQINDLVDEYLLFLRENAPEPDLAHLTQAQRRAMRARFDIVDALADRGPALPSLENDRVAMRLGLVPDRRPDGGRTDPTAAPPRPEQKPSAVQVALEEVESYFEGQVVIDWSPAWGQWNRNGLVPLAQCSTLGDTMALFVAEGQNRDEEVDYVASFLSSHPDISAMGLASADATRAAVLTPAACHRSVDPVRGWLAPGSYVASDRLDTTLHRYFQERLPRWDRVAGLDELMDLGGINASIEAAVSDEVAAAMQAKPRLAYKKLAQQSLATVDQHALGALIVEIQTGRLTGGEAADRIVGFAGATL